ncbi:hypothetical protein A3F08_00865 [Candidatus Berkelbacteria bacterium RIFCSPHIGHO2_12_FULL_36_9]|uniref:Dipeptidylpeptidase IV N-terminal domain-containing protein n=1 Tax=Candidatus Berkelbacteria bacterium RIFCSPHIGHO2_12_FULL_36_9 TaxID=1797469 RepID=A0A1F5EIR4_9BACT|nr:MAG: hypothetical protein A3F08_00865 [Candidatus Berkelbacteria bacterium RIFCSPHIGHO2_12_FULL_36_9]
MINFKTIKYFFKSNLGVGIVGVVISIIGLVLFFNRFNIVSKRVEVTSSPTLSAWMSNSAGVLNPSPSSIPSLTPSPGTASFDNNINFKGKFAYTKYINDSTYFVWNYNNSNKTTAKLDGKDFFQSVSSNDLSSVLRVYYDDAIKKYNVLVFHNGDIDKPFISFSTEKSVINPIFSYEGTKIAYALVNYAESGKNELWTVDYNDSQTIMVLDSNRINSLLDGNNIALDAKRFREVEPISWSRDGDRIYLKISVQGTFESLVYYDLSSKKMVKTSIDNKNTFELIPSPDHGKIAYLVDVSNAEKVKYSLNILNLSNNKTNQLIDSDQAIGGQWLLWSASSDKIAFLEFHDQKYDIAYIDINTRKIQNTVKGLDSSPDLYAWTKNNKIVYSQYLDTTLPNQTLNIINLDGTGKKELDSSWGSLNVFGFVEE